MKTLSQSIAALDLLAGRLDEVSDYVDDAKIDEIVTSLTIEVKAAEDAAEKDTCAECGERTEDCICDEEDDESTDIEEADAEDE
jgi:hypothetical protein